MGDRDATPGWAWWPQLASESEHDPDAALDRAARLACEVRDEREDGSDR